MRTTKCYLTGKEVEYRYDGNHIMYSLTVADNEVDIFICYNCKREISVDEKYHHIIEGLIANGKWPERCEVVSKSCTRTTKIANGETIVLPDYLQTADYPKTPKDKLDHLLLNLFEMQHYDGEVMPFQLDKNFLLKNYFRNPKEGAFYIRGLAEQEFVTYTSYSETKITDVKITHKGLEQTIELTEHGEKSNKCFIAMSFDPEMKPIREAIRAALKETGYEAIIIDEQNVNSDKTINDEMIAAIKKCKFCIADFSLHSHGVYFESGFALGQGKKVIYTCRADHFDNAHFDTKPMQHIVYETPEELTKALINKIEAYID